MTAGYILTGQDLLDGRDSLPDCWPLDRDPLPLETSRVGLFAAGDVRHGSTKRVAAAVGEGSMVASLVFSRLAELGVTVLSSRRPSSTRASEPRRCSSRSRTSS